MNRPCVFIPCLTLLLAIAGCDSWKSRGPDTEVTAAQIKGGSRAGRVAAGPLGRAARVRADRRRRDVWPGLRHGRGPGLSDVLQSADHPGPTGGDGRRREGGRHPPGARGQDLGPAQRHPDANHRLLAGRPGNRPAARSRDPPTPGSLQPGRQRLHRQPPQRTAVPVREVRPETGAVDTGGVHRLVVAAGPVLRRRRPARDDGLLRDQGRRQAGRQLRRARTRAGATQAACPSATMPR